MALSSPALLIGVAAEKHQLKQMKEENGLSPGYRIHLISLVDRA